ncbi:TrpB-like pyridoxal phosphate-dependent enzyme [Actinosynnema sp. NPDC047251]|uniref:Tryptophan synthase beta chain n=1 Tax=Saccharothrix espanaensis (strain ATCC 51144 / DSM 44229 / JCM 9112 / NBRC 15066 / NRRL 15764) TaxID=1179773 RepID=K0JYD7_SACES|nr:TrpB-like pyridoxal phosphate-dependent enzyme [Saccharothrix espanaensis]CCH29719.1 Tryptophan synthase beta chain 2 [Saccharothrix espanaensis DSM 44229]
MKKYLLSEDDLPAQWYNILPDLPKPLLPPLHPVTHEPITAADLQPLLPDEVIAQEFSPQRWIDIPEEVRDVLKIWRPSPLYRADRLEKALDTPAKIYFKYEAVSPAGSHKPNTAIPQVFYNARQGVKRVTTETGAGQWGSALSFAGSLFGVEVTVYMVKASFQQKPHRRSLMETWGGEVFASPSTRTQAGLKILADDPDSPGSLGIAISEAVEDALAHDDTKFALGSAMNHVVLHQTVIGLEAKRQLEIAGDYPDVVVGCVGGGSNYSGLTFPFLADTLTGRRTGTRFIAAEPSACPTLTRGQYAYDYPDTAGLGPLLHMKTMGHGFIPPPIHAGGLRFHGDAPTLCLLHDEGFVEARAYNQNEVFTEAVRFARTEGFVMAPESSHALRGAVAEALAAKEAGEARTILFGFSGHGHFDMGAFDSFLAGRLEDYDLPQEQIDAALADLPNIPARTV